MVFGHHFTVNNQTTLILVPHHALLIQEAEMKL